MACSSYLLESPSATVLLDCGIGSYESLVTLRPEVVLDALIVSHAHPDHVADLGSFLADASRWRGEPEVIAALETIELVAPGITVETDSRSQVRDGAHVAGKWFAAAFSSTTHQIPTLGVEVTMGGSRVVYSADTGPKWAPPTAFRHSDVAILECTIEERGETSSPYHLDAHEVADVVGDLVPSITLLTHVPPGEDAERRRDIVQRRQPATRVIVASVGLSLEIAANGC
jgi:ribonuclease BN (tRNA processing enzyme)